MNMTLFTYGQKMNFKIPNYIHAVKPFILQFVLYSNGERNYTIFWGIFSLNTKQLILAFAHSKISQNTYCIQPFHIHSTIIFLSFYMYVTESLRCEQCLCFFIHTLIFPHVCTLCEKVNDSFLDTFYIFQAEKINSMHNAQQTNIADGLTIVMFFAVNQLELSMRHRFKHHTPNYSEKLVSVRSPFISTVVPCIVHALFPTFQPPTKIHEWNVLLQRCHTALLCMEPR